MKRPLHIMKSNPLILLLASIAPIIAWSAWQPFDRTTWWMEVAPVFLGFIALFSARSKGWRFSNLSLWLIAAHMVILLVGGHYTYAQVPAGDWVKDLLGGDRNCYDRLGHLAQGFVPAILCREIFLRRGVFARRAWLGFCVVCFCLAVSATYELIEWAAALLSADGAAAFLGTQGDVWDTQWDMFCAGIGALCALGFLSRAHDRSIRKVTY